MFLIYDTETTGLPKKWTAPITDSDNWPRMVQISWQLHDKNGELIEVKNYIIKPEGYQIPYDVVKIHGITTERANKQGVELSFVLDEFNKTLAQAQFVVGHNISFDNNIIGAEFHRKSINTILANVPVLDTKDDSVQYCALPKARGNGFKWPKLGELHQKLFGHQFAEAHNAAADVEATARCFFEMIRLGLIPKSKLKFSEDDVFEFKTANPKQFEPIGLDTQPYSPNDFSDEEPEEIEDSVADLIEESEKVDLTNVSFTHLHLHTQYSILDGAAAIPDIVKKAKADGMKAVAISDHGNMFGVKLFHKMLSAEGIKPILGCEAYVARQGIEKRVKENQSGEHLVILAKNEIGYRNLTKMVSLSWLKGFYMKPRIDKEILEEYKEGLIILSACLGGEIPQKLMKSTFEEAEKSALWFKKVFGDDYYLEIQRHKSADPEMNKKVYNDQEYIIPKILEIGKKHNIKVVATNDVHYVNEEDSLAQERLLCINMGRYMSDPTRPKYTGQEWMKTQDEMKRLFADIPSVIATTEEITDKIEEYGLNKNPIMPEFEIPEDFGTIEQYKTKYDETALIEEFEEKRYGQLGGYDKVLRIKFEADYLSKITYEGAKFRWGEINDEQKERLDFELSVIKEMGFPGYFLIVWDFLKAAREMGVVVGPGRGSAAGSAAAYSLRITEIDPIKYDLLFERFLNPDRISMPDIDIDFDDDGRAKILKWVVNKYGEKRVAHIITFGTMAAKSSIRDVARVHEYPLNETDKIAKLVPERPGTSLKDAFKEVKELNDIKKGEGDAAEVLKYAEVLEGSVRNTGTHACGIIIGKEDLENYVPISTAKDSELTYVTQFDGKHVEDIGLLKMDFLGLKTLSIIKDAVENVKLSQGIEVDIEDVDLNDEKTYELYAKGDTVGLFQFESPGMQKHLKNLKPSKFEDLIAMNALYRPGPMEYIPDFIARKHDNSKIEYDVPMMKLYLEETYGITVYQEQVMLLSRHLAGFTRGESDSLRKAMGKKIIKMMDELKVKFVAGCKANPQFVKECEEGKKDIEKIIEKIWGDWEAFAKYAFNKSHATCYSYVSFQTAYLKAHYPAEFMAAVLSRNLSDIKKVTFFMDECKRMSFDVLGPDVNESFSRFTVNKKGNIRFGLEAIKGVGGAAVENIIKERTKKGTFKSVYDFIERVNLSSVNRRTLENLAYSGGFDSYEDIKRYQYFIETDGVSFIEILSKYGNAFQSQNNSQPNLFGDSLDAHIATPVVPIGEEWNIIEKLKKEKELIGIYLSAHPLDPFKLEINSLRPTPLVELEAMEKLAGREITVVGYVTSVEERINKQNKPFGRVVLEDYSGTHEQMFWANKWVDVSKYFHSDYSLVITGRVKENRWREGEFEFETTKIRLLSELKDEIYKSITLNIPMEVINKQFVNNLHKFIDENKGKTSLNVKIYKKDEKIWVDMFSRKYFVNINKNFIAILEKSSNIEHKIN